MTTRPDNRKADLAAIHIATKALGLSTEDAQALKQQVTGKASAADMTAAQRRQLLAHLSGLQAAQAGKPKAMHPARRAELQRSIDDGQDERWTKARALWRELARVGHVHTDTDAALNAYVTRQTKATAWRFLNGHQINNVIEALKQWCKRAGVELQP